MKSLFLVAAELEAFLIERGWRYCFIGGIAVQRWGQPRLTNDIDLTILTVLAMKLSSWIPCWNAFVHGFPTAVTLP